jgi:hypothetical protein
MKSQVALDKIARKKISKNGISSKIPHKHDLGY